MFQRIRALFELEAKVEALNIITGIKKNPKARTWGLFALLDGLTPLTTRISEQGQDITRQNTAIYAIMNHFNLEFHKPNCDTMVRTKLKKKK